ncbi:MAG: hypothetical protein M1132_01380 [Chloroflexi bacterium]|nr:hypothetical protein [Chloroflexota bacterium]
MATSEKSVATNTPIYCVNHPNTETLLHCNRCGRPVCLKCVERTPVGYRCKDCLNVQQAGFYTATPLDYVLATIAGLAISAIGGAVAVAIGFFLFEIFYAPFAGGIIAEVIRYATSKHRGRYLWLLACATVLVGGVGGAGLLPLFLAGAQSPSLLTLLLVLPAIAMRSVLNLGFLIYIVLAVSTVYARLR